MDRLSELQMQIRTYMQAGRSFDYIESEVIDKAHLTDDAKAALWLFAWSYLDPRYQREEALRHIRDIRIVHSG